ncbi:hypothetical protein GF336_02370 [Candidatus Woesearchaeota archaeon]|nr:hypothetical protein [Candidatus Woesearchaeota archaeon]
MKPQTPFEFFKKAMESDSQERMDEIIGQGLKELEKDEGFVFLQRVKNLKKDEEFLDKKLEDIDREGIEIITEYDDLGKKFSSLDSKNRKKAMDYTEFSYKLADIYEQLADEFLGFKGDERSSDIYLISAERTIKRALNSNHILGVTNSVSGSTYRQTKADIEKMKDYFFLRRQSPLTWRYEMNIRECRKGMESAAKREDYNMAALLKERIDFLNHKKDELYERHNDMIGKIVSIPEAVGKLRVFYGVMKEKRKAEKFNREHAAALAEYDNLWKKHDAANEKFENNLAAVEKTIEDYDNGKF